jgi:Holliday junction resolvasome RuvABC endonuclease subunit
MNIISIDPSIANIGIAIYSVETKELILKTLHTKTDMPLEDRIFKICSDLKVLIYEYHFRQAVIENIPEYARKTVYGASVNHGSLMRLNRAVGAIQAMFMNSGIPVYMSPVLTMSKDVQRLYALDICKDADKASEHARAALIHLERFLKRKRIQI